MGVLRALVELGPEDDSVTRLTTEATALVWVLDRELTWAGAMVAVQERVERLQDELMCKSMRKRLGGTVEIQPALTGWAEMAACGVEKWEEWQIVEIDVDWVCPHCGMVNYQPCCADNSRMKR